MHLYLVMNSIPVPYQVISSATTFCAPQNVATSLYIIIIKKEMMVYIPEEIGSKRSKYTALKARLD